LTSGWTLSIFSTSTAAEKQDKAQEHQVKVSTMHAAATKSLLDFSPISWFSETSRETCSMLTLSKEAR